MKKEYKISTKSVDIKRTFGMKFLEVKSGIIKFVSLKKNNVNYVGLFDKGFIVDLDDFTDVGDTFYLESQKQSEVIIFSKDQLKDSCSSLIETKTSNLNWEKELLSMLRNYKGTEQKILGFMLLLNERFGKLVGTDTLIPNFFTHAQLGYLLMISRQSVTTCLARLKREDEIWYDRQNILLRDINKVRASLASEVIITNN